jgi:hypothetical protein
MSAVNTEKPLMGRQNEGYLSGAPTDDRSRRSCPPRILERPDPAQWDENELLNFKEAVALFWPSGPLTVHSLRTAHRSGQLGVAVIAGKFLTTKAAIREMGSCVRRTDTTAQQGVVIETVDAKVRAAVMVENFKLRMREKLTK